MKKQIELIVLVTLFLAFNACQSSPKSTKEDKVEEKSINSKGETIAFKTAKNYFINNTVKEAVPVKITTQEEFDKYFGKAATMGENGKPTPIDFSKEYVIVVNNPDTNKKTDITPISLDKIAKDLVFQYAIKEGEDIGFTMHPFLMIVVEKNIEGNVVLQKN